MNQPVHETEHPIILIVGPTAGGKTEISLCVAEELPRKGECLCVDSMQVYRGMDIGTAKPTRAEQERVPHHLLDLVESDESFTVDHWLEHSEVAIAEVRSRGRHPILVGGTNLYIQAFLAGMMEGPAPDDELRTELEAFPSEQLRSRLLEVDPEAAERIHPNDRRRTIRALEVHQLTGSPISARQGQWAQPTSRNDTILLGLNYPAEVINPRINARVKKMMEDGLLDEVSRLHQAGVLGPQAIEALGYRQLVDHLEGHCSLDEAIEQIKIRTRRFAKHQRTWLKRFLAQHAGLWIDCSNEEPQDIVETAVSEICSHPLLKV